MLPIFLDYHFEDLFEALGKLLTIRALPMSDIRQLISVAMTIIRNNEEIMAFYPPP